MSNLDHLKAKIRHVPDSDSDEEKGAAPDESEDAEDKPVAAVHLRSNHMRVLGDFGRCRFRAIAVKCLGIDRFHGVR